MIIIKSSFAKFEISNLRQKHQDMWINGVLFAFFLYLKNLACHLSHIDYQKPPNVDVNDPLEMRQECTVLAGRLVQSCADNCA